jgi:hypothetical protein
MEVTEGQLSSTRYVIVANVVFLQVAYGRGHIPATISYYNNSNLKVVSCLDLVVVMWNGCGTRAGLFYHANLT